MEARGYHIRASKPYQYNMSAILLDKNSKTLSVKRSRHINIRYFFMMYRVDAGEVIVKHCPTD